MLEFKTLWYNHPINNSVQTPCLAPKNMTVFGQPRLRGQPTFTNQCAIRMGVTLRAAGVTPAQMSGCVTCGVHDKEHMHFIRAREVGLALSRANIPGLGSREVISGKDVAEFYPKLFGRTGLIFFNGYWYRNAAERKAGRPTGDHVDVWNGYRSSAKWLMEWFSWLGYYSNYAGAREIWFWQVD